jgi:prepilin-type processing-associated H-X9-DG protein
LVWVLVDERSDSINDGCFFDDPLTRNTRADLPASYHNGACGFSFADGHAEIKRWHDVNILNTTSTFPPVDPRYPQDLAWLKERTTMVVP